MLSGSPCARRRALISLNSKTFGRRPQCPRWGVSASPFQESTEPVAICQQQPEKNAVRGAGQGPVASATDLVDPTIENAEETSRWFSHKAQRSAEGDPKLHVGGLWRAEEGHAADAGEANQVSLPFAVVHAAERRMWWPQTKLRDTGSSRPKEPSPARPFPATRSLHCSSTSFCTVAIEGGEHPLRPKAGPDLVQLEHLRASFGHGQVPPRDAFGCMRAASCTPRA